EFDVTDCRDEYAGEIWSEPFDGEVSRVLLGPDQYAIYWLTAIPVLDAAAHPGARFEIRGEYPDSRYFSFHSYDDVGVLIDHRDDVSLVPDAGSVNPFTSGQGYPPVGTPVSYRLFIQDVPPEEQIHEPGENVLFGGYLPTGEAVPANQIVYRIYVPSDPSERTGGVPVPRVYYVFDPAQAGSSTPTTKEAACALFPPIAIDATALAEAEQNAEANVEFFYSKPYRPFPGYDPANPVQWFVGESFLGILDQAFEVIPDNVIPTKDEAGVYLNYSQEYIAAFLDPTQLVNKITVVRFKAAVTPKNELGQPIVPGAFQTRYWSACVHQTVNYNWLYGCVHDNQFVRDADAPNYVTIVFSRSEDRPSGLCTHLTGTPLPSGCKYNWLPYASSVPLVLIRHMLPETNFPESPVYYAADPDTDPYDSAALAAWMGEYYPKTKYCTKWQFQLNRCGMKP
ncbi:MAG: hypothetical protein AB1405_16820, partial [Bdellovibrionota bacterium]